MPNILVHLKNDWIQNSMCLFFFLKYSSPLGDKLTCLLHNVTRYVHLVIRRIKWKCIKKGAEGAQSLAVSSLGRKESYCETPRGHEYSSLVAGSPETAPLAGSLLNAALTEEAATRRTGNFGGLLPVLTACLPCGISPHFTNRFCTRG